MTRLVSAGWPHHGRRWAVCPRRGSSGYHKHIGDSGPEVESLWRFFGMGLLEKVGRLAALSDRQFEEFIRGEVKETANLPLSGQWKPSQGIHHLQWNANSLERPAKGNGCRWTIR